MKGSEIDQLLGEFQGRTADLDEKISRIREQMMPGFRGMRTGTEAELSESLKATIEERREAVKEFAARVNSPAMASALGSGRESSEDLAVARAVAAHMTSGDGISVSDALVLCLAQQSGRASF